MNKKWAVKVNSSFRKEWVTDRGKLTKKPMLMTEKQAKFVEAKNGWYKAYELDKAW